MGIVFFCQSCGARFEVDSNMAGKKGRCKKCGQVSNIPRAEEIASMVAMPVLNLAAVGTATAARPLAVARSAPAATSAAGWLKAAMTNVGLSPLSVDQMPAFRRGSAPSPLDDAEDSKPYILTKDALKEVAHAKSSKGANVVAMAWRHEVGGVARVFRWLNQSAYFVSIPFLVLLLIGTAVKSRPLALFAATVVVLLNIGRFVAGVANLLVVPLKDGLNTRKLKKPMKRILEPVVTVALVILGFVFIPWLASSKTSGKGDLVERLRSGTISLKKEMVGEVESTFDKAKNLDIAKIKSEAQAKFDQIGAQSPAVEKSSAKSAGSPEAKVEGLIQAVGKHARETIDQAGDKP